MAEKAREAPEACDTSDLAAEAESIVRYSDAYLQSRRRRRLRLITCKRIGVQGPWVRWLAG